MRIVNLDPSMGKPSNDAVTNLLEGVSEEYLRECVEKISIPRHRFAESENNEAVADWIEDELVRFGCSTFRQGEFNNVVGILQDNFEGAKILIGAHYDTVPKSPGADDNASAVVGMLAAARALSKLGNIPVAFVAFNQEEDGLLGSKDFVKNYLKKNNYSLELVHILEMIGYCDKLSGSQHIPPGLPIKITDKGDFIAIISNKTSNKFVSSLLKSASRYTPNLPVKVLKVFLGVERLFPHLLRSDHSPFWSSNIPAFMWTDTSEFRNPNYHSFRDTPDTLDYDFMRSVTQLLIAQVVEYLRLSNTDIVERSAT